MVVSFMQHFLNVEAFVIAIAFTICTLSQPTAHISERCNYLKDI